MENEWNSKYAIWCDLSLAQGREVPAELHNTIGQDERPPRIAVDEETEENFFENSVDASECDAGPDLQLIQQMLDEVVRSADDNTTEYEPPMNNFNKLNKKPLRNAAVNSLLRTQRGGDADNVLHEPPRFENEENFGNKVPTNPVVCLTNSTNMFKKKCKIVNSDKKVIKPSLNDQKMLQNRTESVGCLEPGVFVPSSHASDYYNKFIEQSKVQEQVHETVWTKVERQMKEIDAKRSGSRKSSSASSSYYR